MRIIWKLALRYMRKNRKRTMAAVLAIAGTMTFLTAVNIFADTFLGLLIENEIKNEGSYHVIFHELSQEQCRELEQSKKVKSCMPSPDCTEHSGEGGFCARVEMKKVSHGIFFATQRLAKKIGMPVLPPNERVQMANRQTAKYQVSYHMKLLEYYGITTESWMGVGLLINVVLALLTCLGCVLIYNAYAISVFEKLKYLGILGSVGACGYQKAFVVYGEGIAEGVVGIPAGIAAGFLLAKGVVFGIQNYFLYEGLCMEVTPRLLGKLVLSGWFMIFAACFFPAVKAVRSSGMDLIVRQYSVEKKVQRKTDLLNEHSFIGTAGMLAMKNVWVRRKNYIANGLVLIIAFGLLLDGFAAMRGMNGDYYIKDDRKRPGLSLWAEINSDDPEKIRMFYEKISGLPGVKTVSLERTLDLNGILLQKGQIKKESAGCDILSASGYSNYSKSLHSIKDCHLGKTAEGYIFHTYLTGLDERTFKEYVNRAGYEIPDDERRPVLIEDYIEVQIKKGAVRRNILNLQPGDDFEFLYSRYGDLSPVNLGVHKEIDEMRKGNLGLIGTTKEAPGYPYYSGDPNDPDGYQEMVKGDIRIYMPEETFDKLVTSPQYKDTYGIHPADTKIYNYMEQKDIPAYIKFDIERKKITENMSFADRLRHKELSMRIEEDKEMERMVGELAAECGLCKGQGKDSYSFGSAAISKREQYFHSEKILLQILGYGVILLILSLSLTNIFQNISMAMRVRRREFAAYRSMGMGVGTLKRMLIAEHSLYGLSASLIGIPVSLFLLNDVFREFERWYTIKRVIPWDIIGIQFTIAVILITAPVIHGRLQLKSQNIIETIRDESN